MATLPEAAEFDALSCHGESIGTARAAQKQWAALPIGERLEVLRLFRAELANGAGELAATIANCAPGALNRTQADTLVAEVLPLAEACRFLEKEAEFTLRSRRESSQTRPFWLRGVDVEVERVALGVVLLIAPGNYPLLLPGVQVLQALAAGNAVLWKPAPAGVRCAHALRVMLIASGMPAALLTVLDPSPAAASAAIEAGVDKVFLTGSAATGQAVLHQAAATATPSVMELSGCDAVFVLERADLKRVVHALTFGLRLNGSATCMAPRRVFVARPLLGKVAVALHTALCLLPPVQVSEAVWQLMGECVDEARYAGAQVLLDGTGEPGVARPTLLTDVTPDMRIARTDLFAPVLSLMVFDTLEQAIEMHERCPYALTTALFGPEKESRQLATELTAGTVIFNDIIVSTADPRVSFGGRKRSGFGLTRGREGLLEMTAPRVLVRQRSRSVVAYQATTSVHKDLFAGYIQAAHGRGWASRWSGVARLFGAMRSMKSR